MFPIIEITNINKILNICDGLIIIGSPIDINPIYYSEQSKEPLHKMCEEIDLLDFTLIKLFSEVDKPILGICRGIQAINVYFGGSLYQDIEGHKLSLQERHKINIEKNSFLYDCYNKESMEVNSTHHQSLKKIAPEFKVTAISEDGVIEAIEKNSIIGVQWHPEMMGDFYFFEKFLEKIQ